MNRLPEPPPAIGLAWAQSSGWACCLCGNAIWSDAVSLGRAPGRSGAHDLSVEVYACSTCAGTSDPNPDTNTQGDA